MQVGFADLAISERIHAEVNNLIHLATVFQYAGYAKSQKFSLLSPSLRVVEPTSSMDCQGTIIPEAPGPRNYCNPREVPPRLRHKGVRRHR